jgi:hypothetical protein
MLPEVLQNIVVNFVTQSYEDNMELLDILEEHKTYTKYQLSEIFRLLELRNKLYVRRAELRKFIGDSEKEIRELEHQLVQQCTHLIVKKHLDPAGGPSDDICEICGKYIY